MVEWGLLAVIEYHGIEDYDYINMGILFLCSLASLLLLRIGFAIAATYYLYVDNVSYCNNQVRAASILVFLFPEFIVFLGVTESHQESKDRGGKIYIGNIQLGAQLMEANIEAMPQVILFYFMIFVFFLNHTKVANSRNTHQK